MKTSLTTLLFSVTLTAVILMPVFTEAQVPNVLSYQGRVSVDGANFDGTGQFKFALVNADGSVTYWSNDGTSTAGGEPTAVVPLTVTKGHYSVLLGEGMTAIPASVWVNTSVRLRVWFNDGVNGSQLLTPDHQVALPPFARGAATVEGVRGPGSNRFFGTDAGNATATGAENMGVGLRALSQINGGFSNTAVGFEALRDMDAASSNTAVGVSALLANVGGNGNTAVGHESLVAVQGHRNIAIGNRAGANLVTGEDNLYIGHIGFDGDYNVIRIGAGGGIHTSAFLAGVRGVTPSLADSLPVVIDSAGQLGTSLLSEAALEDGAVTAAKLQDGVITAAKLAEGSVTGSAIAPGTVIPRLTVTDAMVAGLPNTHYVANHPDVRVGVALPESAEIGDIVEVSGLGMAGWTIDGGPFGFADLPLQKGAGGVGSALIASSEDGVNLVAAQFDGRVFTSDDSGASWTERAGAGVRAWAYVASSSSGGTLAAVVGDAGHIYISNDGGVNWSERGPSADWRSVALSSDGSRMVAGPSNGFIHVSTDGGVTWTSVSSPGQKDWYDAEISADGHRMIVADSGGTMVTSADGGTTWTVQAGAPNVPWFDVEMSSDGMVVSAVTSPSAPSDYGQLYRSDDGGVTWYAQGSPRAWLWLDMSADGHRLVASMLENGATVPGLGGIYQSINGGGDWSRIEQGANWEGVAISQRGGKIFACDTVRGIFATPTTLAGGQGDSMRVQYLGNNVWGRVQPSHLDSDALAAGAVTGEKIAASSITSEKLAAGSVTGGAIADGSIQPSHLGSSIGLWTQVPGVGLQFNSGNVGVGSVSAQAGLSVTRPIQGGIAIPGVHSGLNSDASMELVGAAGWGAFIDFKDVNGGDFGGRIRYRSVGDSMGIEGTSTFSVLEGNVGLGTANPGARVHVHGGNSGVSNNPDADLIIEDDEDTYLQLKSNSGSSFGSGLLFGNSGNSASGSIIYAPNQSLVFSTNSSLGAVIDGNGRLGVGIGNPAASLSVTGSNSDNVVQQGVHLGRSGPGLARASIEMVAQAGWESFIDFKDENQGDFGARIEYRSAFDHMLINGLSRLRIPSGDVTVENGDVSCVAVNTTSDRNAKEDFRPVNPLAVLNKVVGMPISEWRYKKRHDERHIGPMAQDFHEAFALGKDDRHIATVDADGVALAAIQGLNQKLEEKDHEVRELKKSVEELRALVKELAAEKGLNEL